MLLLPAPQPSLLLRKQCLSHRERSISAAFPVFSSLHKLRKNAIPQDFERVLNTLPPICRFQFALPRGARLSCGQSCVCSGRFQFALPRGERLQLTVCAGQEAKFQFALPRGERRKCPCKPAKRTLFQFALPRGERRRRGGALRTPPRFQFALPRGERRFACRHRTATGGFNSRSRVESDSALLLQCRCDQRFNSRSRVGSDHSADFSSGKFSCFNSRSRVGSDTTGNATI